VCAAKGQKRDLENQIRGLLKNLGLLIGPFYYFPAEHWKHLRTTTPIESTFAAMRHRMRSKGCRSNMTALAMAFKLVEAARKSRRPRQPQPVAKDHPGCEVRRRARGHRQGRSTVSPKPPSA
jgi:transposase-like protein